ncbi:hypothetical protein MARPO_0139s0020 [Marchantia polymorpha]|uniref:Uncharacterized protein n=1 Tax=Marchantia polymorpha TaxID=3197 RepID=A0A2R6W6S2_MARPO|nr:hypothetical protein MARPO_0139s0020 [Marchantia polymorpha]|eukprot:PTQ29549.1 hypothetical protein MARPO_0139s0020 [Marchantia polymorpha]
MLIVVNSPFHKGDTAILRQLVGGDRISGKLKHANVRHEFSFSRWVLLISGGLARRMIVFPAHNAVHLKKFLIKEGHGLFMGPLAEEKKKLCRENLNHISACLMKTPPAFSSSKPSQEFYHAHDPIS